MYITRYKYLIERLKELTSEYDRMLEIFTTMYQESCENKYDILDFKAYSEFNQTYQKKLEYEMHSIKQEMECYREDILSDSNAYLRFLRYRKEMELTDNMYKDLIEKVYITNGHISVQHRYSF